jgi:carbamoyltransferase
VAPIVLQEEVHLFVDTVADAFSPYMSFAPTLQPWVQDEFPDIAHIDGTARIQTVTSFGGTWIAKLLMQLKTLRGHAILVNTSFNEKGLPILNRVSTAFALFDKHSEMAGLLIEDWWFDRSL